MDIRSVAYVVGCEELLCFQAVSSPRSARRAGKGTPDRQPVLAGSVRQNLTDSVVNGMLIRTSTPGFASLSFEVL